MLLPLQPAALLALVLAGLSGLMAGIGMFANNPGAANELVAPMASLSDSPANDLQLSFVPASPARPVSGQPVSGRQAMERSNPFRMDLKVGKGDTLVGLLLTAGMDRTEANLAAETLATVYDPRRLQVGQAVTVLLTPTNNLVQLGLQADAAARVVVTRDAAGAFAAHSVTTPLVHRDRAGAGTIESSLAAATDAEGIADTLLLELIRLYAHQVDFQRDLQPGDAFEILHEDAFDTAGQPVRTGPVLYAKLRLSGRGLPLYRFETADGAVDYYTPEGESVRRLLLRTPIDGARISSGFGHRRHPILGYSRLHRGVDFAASTGTPIFAAGDGVVETIGPNKGYGRYIRLRHAGDLATAYAHLSRFADGLERGDRVQQGEVIGYVGTTGLSTGPHLHYEVWQDDAAVNPLDLDLPVGRTLDGDELARFDAWVSALHDRFNDALAPIQVAQHPGR